MTQQRRGLLRDLADVARQLSDDELRVLVTIAARAWMGQTKYGCLDLRHERRDLGHEAFEETCDAAFYLAAKLVTAGHSRPRRDRRNRLAAAARGVDTVLCRPRRREFLAAPAFAFDQPSRPTLAASARRRRG